MRILFLPLLIGAALVLAGCDDAVTEAQTAQQPPPPVTVAVPLQKNISEWDEFTGRFEAAKEVEIRSRVSGFLDRISFRDGEIVRKGALLFIVDPRPFRIALERAKAEVEQARAQLELTANEVKRGEPLAKANTIPQSELESRQAREREAAALLKQAEARVRDAELSLEWTEVRAPISGRISDARVDVGNLISGGQASSTVLTTIVSLDPIHFVFEASEADFLKYSRKSRSGQRPSSRDNGNPVSVRLADEKEFKHEGTMDFVDNVLDPNSGTVRGRARFNNSSFFLTPGVFGRMRLFGGRSDALLVPDASILSDQARKIVLTVADDGTVGPKIVTTGPLVDGLRVVRSGLKADDKIIIKGIQRARAGQKVTPQDGKIEPPAQASN